MALIEKSFVITNIHTTRKRPHFHAQYSSKITGIFICRWKSILFTTFKFGLLTIKWHSTTRKRLFLYPQSDTEWPSKFERLIPVFSSIFSRKNYTQRCKWGKEVTNFFYYLLTKQLSITVKKEMIL